MPRPPRECPPGVHSIFDPCPGDCGEPLADRSPETRYAWCFSHGLMHRFRAGEDPWCTAVWAYLEGESEEEAQSHKKAAFGDAVFEHHLPTEVRAELWAHYRSRPA